MSNKADYSKSLRGGNVGFADGMDGGIRPSALGPNQFALGLNVTARGGPIKNRPGWFRHDLTFDGGLAGPTGQGFSNGYFQEALGFQPQGNGDPMILASIGGRQFAIDLLNFGVQDMTPAAAEQAFTTAPFTIPAVGATVTVAVSDSSLMELRYSSILIGGYTLTLTQIPTSTSIVVRNDIVSQVGLVIGQTTTTANFTVPGAGLTTTVALTDASQLSVDYLLTVTGLNLDLVSIGGSGVTTTTADFTVPVAGATVVVAVADSSHMTTSSPNVYVRGLPFVLTGIGGPTSITLKNLTPANQGVVITHPANVAYSYAPNTVTVLNPVATGAGNVITSGTSVTFNAPIVYTKSDPNNPNNTLNWSVQAGIFWILQDNAAAAIIFDGAKTYRSDPSKSQVPCGNVMCYAQGRLLVALPDRQSYAAGDIYGGSSGTATYNFQDAQLYFTENNYLNEGGNFVARTFGAPNTAGDIVSMTALAQTDTQLGQGPVVIGTPTSVFTVNLPFDRTTWKNLQNPLQTNVPMLGPTGQSSTINVNTDLWFRSLDGIRSYVQAWRQMNGGWGNTPSSNELDDLLATDEANLLEHASAVLFDNRILVTVNPTETPQGVYWAGLAVMDLDLVTSLRRKSPPAWEGLWSGIRPAATAPYYPGILKIITATVLGVQRCFMFVLNSQSLIELWELSKTDKFDQGSQQVPISSAVWLPSYTCGDQDRFKTLDAGRMLVNAVSGQLVWSVEYRTDEWPCWVPWQAGRACSINQDCGPFACSGPIQYQDQPRRPIRLGTPPDDFNGVTNISNRKGYEFQPRIRWTGYAEITGFYIFCSDTQEMLGPDRADEDICSTKTVGGIVYLTAPDGSILTDGNGVPLTIDPTQ